MAFTVIETGFLDFVCEKAVDLAPENKLPLFKAYWGVAKAQTGDKKGAR